MSENVRRLVCRIIKSLRKISPYNRVSCVLQKLRRVERLDESAALQHDGILRPLLIQGHLWIGSRQSKSFLRSRQFRRCHRRISEGSAALQQQRKRDVRQSAKSRVHDLIESRAIAVHLKIRLTIS